MKKHTDTTDFILKNRPRRNRRSEAIRALLQTHFLRPEDFVWPVFITEGVSHQKEIAQMPNCYVYSKDVLLKKIQHLYKYGLKAVALFPVLENSLKNNCASESYNSKGLVQQTVCLLKKTIPELCIITDVAMDPYSSDGQDGLVKDKKILNDPTLKILAAMAVSQAQAGADYVAPSDMMDGRVGFIREALDQNNFSEVGIISYSVKYASNFYAPFRSALNSEPLAGDKKTYQMNVAGSKSEALREVFLDIKEGADIIMIKPALSYLDIVSAVKDKVNVPVAAYNVSGEYAMIKAAHKQKIFDEKKIALESLTSIKRAGADIIFSYWVPQVFSWLFNAKI